MVGAALPEKFLWGATTAAHQVEGDNVNSDCWALEHARPSLFAEPSLGAADHYHRFADDVAVLAALGLNAYRFSIEWARVEPEPGHYSIAALDHYRRCVDICRGHGLVPVVTLHHFTQPLWMARLGGFGSSEFPKRFADYARCVVSSIDGIAVVCTLNELNLPISAAAYFTRRASPEARAAAEAALGAPLSSFFLLAREDDVLERGLGGHRAARDAIRSVRADIPVGMTLAISEEGAEPGAEAARDARSERFYAPFLDAARDDDFVGVQTYSRTMSRTDGGAGPARDATLTTMGWEDRPEALSEVCRWIASRWRTPMIVTENGYPGEDDARRAAFIQTAIAGLKAAIADGADVRGYFYWSLLDNFEWMLGYRQRFGLIGVDRSMMRRTLKPSATTLSRVAAASKAVTAEELAVSRPRDA